MTTFEIPALTTGRLRLRAFRAGDLDAFAAMRANPEVVRYLGTRRTSTPVEAWRKMGSFLGQWALRGYGLSACEKIDGGGRGDFDPRAVVRCRHARHGRGGLRFAHASSLWRGPITGARFVGGGASSVRSPGAPK
jgi:RimJ/RimL family protein N-acetyltransferase